MEDCNICYQSKEKMLKAKTCGHELCLDCFKSLRLNTCPYCRQSYTREELVLKGTNNLQIQQYNPPQYHYISRRLDYSEEISIQVPFSRVRRNMVRKRRRNLTFEEIKEKRRLIKKRMKLKWTKKNGRLNKHSISV